jgi:hypothetical protein
LTDLRAITIISGGQTGADRAALDFAIANGFAHGGWCPRGRLSEDGAIPDRYKLRETPSRKYAVRTEWNVRDSDATAVFSVSTEPQGGTKLTLDIARRLDKPVLHLSRAIELRMAASLLREFLAEYSVETLNVAGPRASQEPDIVSVVTEVLSIALSK